MKRCVPLGNPQKGLKGSSIEVALTLAALWLLSVTLTHGRSGSLCAREEESE